MVNNVLNDLLDFRYATPYNLHSRVAEDFKSSLVQVRKDIHRLLAAGYIAKVDEGIPLREAIQKQFYKATVRGADFVDRKEDWVDVERKASSSLNHEMAKIDICRSFKIFYGANKFEYHVSIGKHRPDAVIHSPYKLFLEIEIKDRPDKVIQTLRKYDNSHTPVLVVYCHWGYNPIKRFQERTDADFVNARFALHLLLAKVKKANLPDRFLFAHHINYHKINEHVWFAPDGANFSVESYGKSIGLINN